MSFVIGLATPSAALIMSDGRCCRGDCIVTENYDKTRYVSENVIVGFSGESELCESALYSAMPHPDDPFTIYPVPSYLYTVDLVAYYIQQFLIAEKLPRSRKCAFIVAGTNDQGVIEMDILSIANGLKIEKRIPTESTQIFATLSPDGIDGNSIVGSRLADCRNPKEVLEQAINDMALRSSVVNRNHYSQLIYVNPGVVQMLQCSPYTQFRPLA